eukprot:GSA120T00001535001.1
MWRVPLLTARHVKKNESARSGAVCTPTPAPRILADDFRFAFFPFELDLDVLSTTDVELLQHARTNEILESGGGVMGPHLVVAARSRKIP